jgi:hypothetical protein
VKLQLTHIRGGNACGGGACGDGHCIAIARCARWWRVGWRCEGEARVVGNAMRDDDWEVTRLASLQPIRAEQIMS